MFNNKLKNAPTPPGTPGKSHSSSLQRKYVASTAIVSAPLLSNKSPANAMVVIPPNTIDQPPEYLRPQTSAAQYWAIRALKAETILQARTVHHRELQSLGFSEQTKRSVSMPSYAYGVWMHSDELLISLTHIARNSSPLPGT